MYAAIQRSPVGGWVSENLGHLTQFLKFVIDLYATNAEEPIPYCIEAHLLCAAQTTTPEFFSMSQSPYSLREHQKVSQIRIGPLSVYLSSPSGKDVFLMGSEPIRLQFFRLAPARRQRVGRNPSTPARFCRPSKRKLLHGRECLIA
jgi:hypothetical protein